MRFYSTIYYILFILFGLSSCQKSNISIDSDNVLPTIGPNMLTNGWSYSQPEFINKNSIPDIFFLDNNFGAFITFQDLYITRDGGLNWKPFINNNFKKQVNGNFHLFITPAKDIFMIGSQYIFRVSNDSVTVISNTFGGVGDIFFISDKIGYVSNSYVGSRTIDSGKTWIPLNLNSSIDSGKTWIPINSNTLQNNSRSNISSLSFLKNGKGMITFDNFCATNFSNDTSWRIQPKRIGNIIASFIVSDSLSFISTYDGIYRSLNGARTFNAIFSFSNSKQGYYDIHFVDEKTGYFCKDNQIYKTVDGGDNWSVVVRLTMNKDESIIELHFTSPNNGWACTSKGGILKYTL